MKLNKRNEEPLPVKKAKFELKQPKFVQSSLPVMEKRANKRPDNHPAV